MSIDDLLIVEKRKSRPHGKRAAMHYYACGPVRASRREAERDADTIAAALDQAERWPAAMAAVLAEAAAPAAAGGKGGGG